MPQPSLKSKISVPLIGVPRKVLGGHSGAELTPTKTPGRSLRTSVEWDTEV